MGAAAGSVDRARAIAHRVEPVGPLVTGINGNLTAVADALEALARDLDPQDEAKAS